jgi:DNA-binding response OmpR family regulator
MSESVGGILILEDEEPVRSLWVRALEEEGYRTYPAGGVERAVEILRQEAVALILLDLHMPGPQNGEDLLFRLRDEGSEVPIVVVSGWVDDETTLSIPECVHAVLKKPIAVGQLVDAVRRALG